MKYVLKREIKADSMLFETENGFVTLQTKDLINIYKLLKEYVISEVEEDE